MNRLQIEFIGFLFVMDALAIILNAILYYDETGCFVKDPVVNDNKATNLLTLTRDFLYLFMIYSNRLGMASPEKRLCVTENKIYVHFSTR